jgi:hypothetical protein
MSKYRKASYHEFPPSVVLHAMLDEALSLVAIAESEWGELPPVEKRLRNGGMRVSSSNPIRLRNLYDLIIERCEAVYRCNDDSDPGAYAAWNWVKKNCADHIARHWVTYGPLSFRERELEETLDKV